LDGRNRRQQHVFLSIGRLLIDQLLRHPPPFSTGSGSMGLGRSAVDHMNVPVCGLDQSFE